MKTELIKISKIVHNTGQIDGLPKNPRKKNDELFAKLVKSIQDDPEMLELRELLVYPHGDKYIVIAGNMRLDALEQLGYKDAPCKVIPIETPVEKLKAYTIKDNASFGEWDMDMLVADWDVEQLDEWGVDIDVENVEVLDEEEVHEDEFDESEVQESIVKPLEVWQLGKHRLMCGDSTSANDVAVLMDGAKADLVFTDPPYGVNFEKKAKSVLKSKEYRKIANDDLKGDEFKEFLSNVFNNAVGCMKETASYYVFSCQGGDMEMMMMMMMRECGMPCRHQLIWVKDAPVFSMGRLDYDYKHEPILYGWMKHHTFYRKGEQDKSVWSYSRTSNKLHPTMKPIELISNALLNSSIENDIVLDLFGGSGSTLIACEQLHRKCYMMELDPHYCDVIIARWEKLTGQKAVKL